MFGDQLLMLLTIWGSIAVVAAAGIVAVVSSIVTRRKAAKSPRNTSKS